MLGDDANLVFLEMLKKLLEIVKLMGEHNNLRYDGGKNKTPKMPKIRSGSISKKEFEKLRRAGTDFKYVSVPNGKLGDIEQRVKELGGSMFTARSEQGNNAVLAVPAQCLEAVNIAVKDVMTDIMKENPNELIIQNGTDKLSEDDTKIAADVLRSHDIPVYSCKANDGKYINVVPKEYDGQYKEAMKEAREISERLKNIEVTRYEQTSPLDGLDIFASKMSYEAARALYAAAKFNDLDVKFARLDDGVAAVYPAEIAAKVEKARNDYEVGVDESEKYLIDIRNGSATMDKDKLLLREDENTYLVKIPNTDGRDHLLLNKKDVELINGGKTLSYNIDREKTYPIYDKDGQVKSEQKGSELAAQYNIQNIRGNKDTVVTKYGDGLDRIELYNAEKNRLISLSIDNADKVRTELKEQGISAGAADKLLKDINDKLPEEYREKFNYSAEKTEIVYSDIPNIGEYLAQSQLSQQLVGKAECHGELPKDSGSKCCVYDKSSNQYAVLPVLPRLEVQSKLTDMGYSEISAKEIADKIVSSYRENDNADIISDRYKLPSMQRFDSSNSELSNTAYSISENSAVIVQEKGESYKYVEIDKGTSPQDVRKALGELVADERSAAEVIKCLAAAKIVETAAAKQEDITVNKLTDNYVEICKDGNSAVCHKNALDTEKLAEMGIPEKTSQSIQRSLDRAEKNANGGGRQTISELKEFAKNAASKMKDAAVKTNERTTANER